MTQDTMPKRFLFPAQLDIPSTPEAIATLAYLKARALDDDGIYNRVVDARGFDPLGNKVNRQ